MPAERPYSIGEVLSRLTADFPDVTISKIRFLETEGLVEPARTPSGYRQFSDADIERLRYVLSLQRDRYLPLRVIREHLDALDRGVPGAGGTEDGGRGGPGASAHRARRVDPAGPSAADFRHVGPPMRLTRAELLEGSGLTEAALVELESYGLVTRRPAGSHYDATALRICATVAAMNAYGIEARHLRPYKVAADREVGLMEQVLTPMLRGAGPGARQAAEEAACELAALSVRLRTALVSAGLDEDLLA